MTVSVRAVGAIFRSEGTALYSSWLLRLWLLLVVALALLTLASIDQARTVSRALAGWLAAYSVPSAIAVGVLGAAALSSDLEVAADSVLSRAVTRIDFVLGKTLSRLGLVAAIHLAVTLPTMLLAQRIGARNAETAQIFIATGAVGLTLVFLAALGSLLGALFRNTIVAVAVLMVAFASQSLIFDFLGADYLSPGALLRNMAAWLDGRAGAWEQARFYLAFGGATAACLGAAILSFERRDL